MKKYSFPPIVDENSKVLILGTMPGERSLKLNQYYANPQNQFWKIMTFVTEDNLQTTYKEKTDLLLKNKIAIWDALMHCEREGSLDADISEEVANDFDSFYTEHPNINAVFFNGGKSSEYYCTYIGLCKDKSFCTLPSTSSANTSMTLDRKAQIWKAKISEFL